MFEDAYAKRKLWHKVTYTNTMGWSAQLSSQPLGRKSSWANSPNTRPRTCLGSNASYFSKARPNQNHESRIGAGKESPESRLILTAAYHLMNSADASIRHHGETQIRPSAADSCSILSSRTEPVPLARVSAVSRRFARRRMKRKIGAYEGANRMSEKLYEGISRRARFFSSTAARLPNRRARTETMKRMRLSMPATLRPTVLELQI
jgi:hypothetical protein